MYVITIYNYVDLENASDAGALPITIHNEFVQVGSPKITRAKNNIDSLTFDIYPDNPGYDYVNMLGTTIKVYDTDNGWYIFDGRVLTPPGSMDSDGLVYKSVTCEGILGYLCDSRQGYLEERLWEGNGQKTGLQQYLEYILGVHNAHMPPFKQVFMGDVDVETYRTTENVYKGTNFETTWEIIQKKLIDVYGGEVRARRGGDGRIYLDYKEVLGYEIDTPIKVGLNLESSSRDIDPNQLITRLYPRGCKLVETSEDEEGNVVEEETEQRLDITSENGGVPYIDDDRLIKEFGIIEGTHEWDDVTDAANLLHKGEQWLEANNRLPVTTEVSALDLSLIDDKYIPFDLYNWHHVLNTYNDIDETLEIVGQTIDLADPTASTITLGESTTLQSHRIALLEGLKGQVEYLQSRTVTTERNIGYYVRYTMSAIEIAEDRIVSTVGEELVSIGDDIDVVSARVSKVEQTADGITTSIQKLTEKDEFLETKIEETAEGIKTTVTDGYVEYVEGQLAPVSKRMTSIEQTATDIKQSVTDLDKNLSSKIESTANSIKLEVTGGSLGSTASIKLTVNDQTKSTGSINMTNVRQSFANDNTAITIRAGIVSFWSNTFVVDSTYFKVSSDGKITATGGTIGGITIASNSLYSGRTSLSGPATGFYLDNTGISTGNGSTWCTMSRGRIYGSGGSNSSETGYVSFNSVLATTGAYGTRIAGQSGVSFLTNGTLSVGSYVSFGSSATVKTGGTKAVQPITRVAYTTGRYSASLKPSTTKYRFVLEDGSILPWNVPVNVDLDLSGFTLERTYEDLQFHQGLMTSS